MKSDDPYWTSERFLTTDYWIVKWKARQFWYERYIDQF